MGREAWQATVHGVAKSQTWLSDWATPPPTHPQANPKGVLSTMLLLCCRQRTQLASFSLFYMEMKDTELLSFQIPWFLCFPVPNLSGLFLREPQANSFLAVTIPFLSPLAPHLHRQREALSSMVIWCAFSFIRSNLLFKTYILYFLGLRFCDLRNSEPWKWSVGFWNSKAVVAFLLTHHSPWGKEESQGNRVSIVKHIQPHLYL